MAAAQGDRARADEAARHADALDEGQPFVHITRGQALERAKDGPNGKTSKESYAAAAECYRAALRADKNYAPAHLCLGAALCDGLGELDDAAAAFDRVLALTGGAPGEGGGWALAASAEDAGGAQRQLRVQAQYNLGNVRFNQGRYDEALAAWRAAVALDPGYALAWQNLARTLEMQGDAAGAAAARERAGGDPVGQARHRQAHSGDEESRGSAAAAVKFREFCQKR